MENTPQNIQIPYELFKAILDTLEHIDESNYAEGFRSQLESVLEALKDK